MPPWAPANSRPEGNAWAPLRSSTITHSIGRRPSFLFRRALTGLKTEVLHSLELYPAPEAGAIVKKFANVRNQERSKGESEP